MSARVECPLCGASPARRWRRHSGFTIVSCRGCGLRITWPRPSAAELAALYDDAAYYDARAMGAAVSAAWVERAREILAAVPAPVERALDVGAGEGHAVAALRALGVQAHGVEPSPAARAAALARYGVTLDAELPPAGDGSWDLVTYIHALEHFADPVDALRRAAARLRPGGCVFIEVPHARSIELLTRRGRERLLDLPAHLYHFVPATLTRVAERAGLEVSAVRLANPEALERLFAWRARRRAQGGGARAEGPVTAAPPAGGAAPRSAWRRHWGARVLPWLRERFPGYKFQLVARRPPVAPEAG